MKKFGKELGNDDQHITVKSILFFVRQNHNEDIRSVRVKYIVYSPTKVVLNLTELLYRRQLEGH